MNEIWLNNPGEGEEIRVLMADWRVTPARLNATDKLFPFRGHVACLAVISEGATVSRGWFKIDDTGHDHVRKWIKATGYEFDAEDWARRERLLPSVESAHAFAQHLLSRDEDELTSVVLEEILQVWREEL